MRILLVSFYHVEYAIELANGLRERHEVCLVLSADRVGQTIGGKLDELLHDTVKCITLNKRSSWFSLGTWKSMVTVLTLLFSNTFDVIHLQDSGNTFNILFLLFSFKPVVFTIHDVTLHPGNDTSKAKKWRFWIRGLLIKYRYNKVIVHGERLKVSFVAHYDKSADDVFVVPHGCLFSFLKCGAGLNVPEEAYAVLFFGRMEAYKGLKYLIMSEPIVSARIPHFKIVVAGTGVDLSLYKASLMANPHFEVHDDFIPNDQVLYYFKRAAVVVLPYTEASQSGIAAMAFAFGKPVIVTDVGSLSEVVQDGKAGRVVQAGNAEQLAAAIIDLLENKGKRAAMGREALRLAQTTLSWRNIALQTECVYRSALH